MLGGYGGYGMGAMGAIPTHASTLNPLLGSTSAIPMAAPMMAAPMVQQPVVQQQKRMSMPSSGMPPNVQKLKKNSDEIFGRAARYVSRAYG